MKAGGEVFPWWGLGLEGVKKEENNRTAALVHAPSLLRSRICLGSRSLAGVNRGV